MASPQLQGQEAGSWLAQGRAGHRATKDGLRTHSAPGLGCSLGPAHVSLSRTISLEALTGGGTSVRRGSWVTPSSTQPGAGGRS